MRHNSAATAGLGNSRQPPYMVRCWSWSGDTAAIPELPGLFRMISPNVYVNVFRPASHFTCQLLHTLPAALWCSTWRTSDKCLYTVICFGIMIWTSLKRKYYGTSLIWDHVCISVTLGLRLNCTDFTEGGLVRLGNSFMAFLVMQIVHTSVSTHICMHVCVVFSRWNFVVCPKY